MDTQSHIGANPTGGSTHLIHHQNVQDHGTSRHPTNDEEARPLVPHEHARINLNRREGSEPVAAVYQEGRQGSFPAVRFHVPRRQGSTTATAASPGGIGDCDCGHRTFSATMSSSTMQPPQPPPKGPVLSPVSELKQEEEEAKRVEEDVKRVEVKPADEDGKQVAGKGDGKGVEGKEAKPIEKDVERVEVRQAEDVVEVKRVEEEVEPVEEGRTKEAFPEKSSASRPLQDSGPHAKESRTQQDSPGPFKEKGSLSDHGSQPRDRTSTRPHSRVPSGVTTILLDAPLPSLPRDDRNDGVHDLRRARTRGTGSTLYSNRPLPPSRQHSGIDWIVPVDPDDKVSFAPHSKLDRLLIF